MIKNNRILVTGGAGYIGSHAVRLLLEENYKVIVVDNLYRGYKKVIEYLQSKYGKENVVFYQTDLRDFEKIKEILIKERPDTVLHFAALCLVNESMEKPELYFDNNVIGSLNLFRAMTEAGIKKIVFSSTCAVYGESKYLPVDENHPTNPTNPYGESKLIAEKILSWIAKTHDLNYVIFRYFNVAGAWHDGEIGDSKKPSQLLVQNAVRGALGIEEFKLTCPTVSTPDKTPIRDYINVEDLVKAHVMVLKYLDSNFICDVFNLGTGSGASVLEIVDNVKKITGVDFDILQSDKRKGEYAKVYADITKVKNFLSWKSEKNMKMTVESLVKWYTKHPKGWEN